ncbi:hypothetical protein HG530_003289 [Fusarium avenaceum]|nr:hypothetical protein HG530_003289 [Fusarium avenaceum]
MVKGTRFSHPEGIESAANGFGIVGQFLFKGAFWLGNDNRRPATSWSPRVNRRMVRSRFHCSRHSYSVVVIVTVIFVVQSSRTHAPFGLAWTRDPQDFIVLIPLAF